MNAKRKYRKLSDPPTLICQQCEEEFHPLLRLYGSKNHGFYYEQKFCSKGCANKARPPKIWVHKRTGYPMMTSGGKSREIHRVVMERMIGRPLRSEETVHHKNGDRLDYSEKNLELWSGRHGKGTRIQDQQAWAEETLKLYGPEPFGQKHIDLGMADVLRVFPQYSQSIGSP